MAANFVKLPGGAIGAKIEDLTQLSSHLTQATTEFESVFKRIDAKISATVWAGQDADRCSNDWNQTHTQVMNSLRQLMDQLSTAIRQQAAQQQQTSAG